MRIIRVGIFFLLALIVWAAIFALNAGLVRAASTSTQQPTWDQCDSTSTGGLTCAIAPGSHIVAWEDTACRFTDQFTAPGDPQMNVVILTNSTKKELSLTLGQVPLVASSVGAALCSAEGYVTDSWFDYQMEILNIEMNWFNYEFCAQIDDNTMSQSPYYWGNISSCKKG